jgi:Ca2+-binding EF-hand superfamily protein
MLSIDRQVKVCGVLLAGLVATAALGADAPAPPASSASPCQCSRHGDIDLGKMKERASQTFDKADANHDGKISEAEFLAFKSERGAWGGPGPGARKGMGGPGMGAGPHGGAAPTPQEREAFQADLFKALDTDHNGQLSAAEFSKSLETARTLMQTQTFKKLDKNGDGALTRDEFPPYAAKMSAMDTNGDGTVTHDEMKAAHAAHGSQTPTTPPN